MSPSGEGPIAIDHASAVWNAAARLRMKRYRLPR